jgi:type IV pilus assembly protein PilM
MGSARSAWGIDIGDSALKAVALVRHGEELQVEDFELVEHARPLSRIEGAGAAPGTAAAATAATERKRIIRSSLQAFLDRHSVDGTAIATSISGLSSFVRCVTLPPVESARLPKMIQFEAAQHIPSPLTEVEWRYQFLPRGHSAEAPAIICAARREILDAQLAHFREMGMDVQLIQVNGLATYNALRYEKQLAGATLVIDMGASHTELLICEGEGLWLRSIPLSGKDLTEALASKLGMSFDEAEHVKCHLAGGKHARAGIKALEPAFAAFADEVARSISAYTADHPATQIARLIPLGGGLRMAGLLKFLQQRLQVELSPVRALSAGAPADGRLAAAFAENLSGLLTAHGLAVQAAGTAKLTLSLLPAHVRRTKTIKRVAGWLAAATLALILGAVGWFIFAFLRSRY